MQALYCGNLGEAGGMVGQRMLREIGQTGIPVVNCANACATGATAFREGWMAIKAGHLRRGAVRRRRADGQGPYRGRQVGGGAGIPTEGLLGSGTMPAVFAHVGMEHTRKYGTTFEQFAKVSVKNHHHSTLNPKAMYQMETPLAGSDGRGDDLLSEHQADVLGERRRLGGRGALSERARPRSSD